MLLIFEPDNRKELNLGFVRCVQNGSDLLLTRILTIALNEPLPHDLICTLPLTIIG